MLNQRLFIALIPDPAMREQIQAATWQLAIRTNPQGKRLIEPENYHLTLQFLGPEIGATQATAIRQALSLVKGAPITLALDIASSFTASDVWWLGPREVPTALIELRAEITRRTASVGIATDRTKFVPHVSIMKVAQKLPPTQVPAIAWSASAFSLMSSTVTKEGSRYEVMETWPILPGQARAAGEQISLL